MLKKEIVVKAAAASSIVIPLYCQYSRPSDYGLIINHQSIIFYLPTWRIQEFNTTILLMWVHMWQATRKAIQSSSSWSPIVTMWMHTVLINHAHTHTHTKKLLISALSVTYLPPRGATVHALNRKPVKIEEFPAPLYWVSLDVTNVKLLGHLIVKWLILIND